LTLFIVVSLSGCFSPWRGDNARFVISFAGSERASSARQVIEDNIIQSLEHKLELTHGTEKITFSGKGTIIEGYAPAGDWTIWVYSYLDGDLYAAGYGSAFLQFGQDNTITINMRRAYKVEFDSNGGIGTVPPIKKIMDRESITLPGGDGLSNEGFVFGGWNISADGTETSYSVGSSYTVTGNITLYAVWINAQTAVTVTFGANGGNGEVPQPIPANDGDSIILPGGDGLSKDGYVFGGWNSSEDGTGTPYSVGSSYTVTGDITLYAVWIEAEKAVTVTAAAIAGVTAPATGGTPVTAITETAQYSGTVTWSPAVSETFAPATQYTATITLTTKGDYVLQGVAANFFTVAGADVTNAANSGVITAVFPATEPSPFEYIITRSDAQFTATRSGVTTGTANQTIQDVINAIRTDANGEACSIQFGSGGDNTLDIGTASASFNNTGGTWGAITLTGKITGNISSSSSGTIATAGAVSITSTADIANTASTNGIAVFHNSSGAVTINGTVSATTGYAVYNNSIGALNISGGEVKATTGMAIYNNNNGKITVSGTTTKITSANTGTSDGTIRLYSSGDAIGARLEITGGTVENTATGNAVFNISADAVNINGGTVSATTGAAVYNASIGKVTVSGTTTKVTSENTNTSGGTVYIANNGNYATDVRLEITGGTVENTTNGGNAVHNESTGAVTISGGEVKATTGNAVFTATTGKVTVSGNTKVTSANTATSGGTVYLADGGYGSIADRLVITGGTVENTAAGGRAVYNNSTGAITISGGLVQATTGRAIHNNSIGAVNISGGTVSAITGMAIFNYSTGKITVSETAGNTTKITSANTDSTEGTIRLYGSGTGDRLEITGGTVENTSATSGNAVYSVSTGAITMSGGTVSATGSSSYTMHNASTGAVTVFGGTVSATRSIAVYNTSTGAVNISGGTVSATTGQAVFNASTGTITMSGGTVSATETSGRAIHNNSTGAITITNGTVSATGAQGYSIYNNSTGVVTITAPPAVIDGEKFPKYFLGDTGPGGGKIFYYSAEGFTFYASATDAVGTKCYYLEAAPADMASTLRWAETTSAAYNNSVSGTGTEIGTGRKNTALILAVDANAPAAKACNDSTTGSKTDWFLPSKEELNQLYVNRNLIGNMGTTNTYWSSSQSSTIQAAWYQLFSNGNQDEAIKGGANSVRAIRAF
jgi:uncharacterized repeat protein (TIGR02543 family)